MLLPPPPPNLEDPPPPKVEEFEVAAGKGDKIANGISGEREEEVVTLGSRNPIKKEVVRIK